MSYSMEELLNEIDNYPVQLYYDLLDTLISNGECDANLILENVGDSDSVKLNLMNNLYMTGYKIYHLRDWKQVSNRLIDNLFKHLLNGTPLNDDLMDTLCYVRTSKCLEWYSPRRTPYTDYWLKECENKAYGYYVSLMYTCERFKFNLEWLEPYLEYGLTCCRNVILYHSIYGELPVVSNELIAHIMLTFDGHNPPWLLYYLVVMTSQLPNIEEFYTHTDSTYDLKLVEALHQWNSLEQWESIGHLNLGDPILSIVIECLEYSDEVLLYLNLIKLDDLDKSIKFLNLLKESYNDLTPTKRFIPTELGKLNN